MQHEECLAPVDEHTPLPAPTDELFTVCLGFPNSGEHIFVDLSCIEVIGKPNLARDVGCHIRDKEDETEDYNDAALW